MNSIFVDTSAWDALADKADKHHLGAIRFRDEIAGTRKLLTSNYILDELFTLLLLNIGYAQTIAYKENLIFSYSNMFLISFGLDKISPLKRGGYLRDTTMISCGHSQIARHTL